MMLQHFNCKLKKKNNNNNNNINFLPFFNFSNFWRDIFAFFSDFQIEVFKGFAIFPNCFPPIFAISPDFQIFKLRFLKVLQYFQIVSPQFLQFLQTFRSSNWDVSRIFRIVIFFNLFLVHYISNPTSPI